MPSGAGVIRYEGTRGVVWRVKYRDAEGRQVQETVGAERDGVTRKQAEAELRERLTRVAKKGYRRPKPITFGQFARTWFEEGKSRRAWKPKTIRAYGNALDRLEPSFGRLPIASIRPRDVAAHVKEALATRSSDRRSGTSGTRTSSGPRSTQRGSRTTSGRSTTPATAR